MTEQWRVFFPRTGLPARIRWWTIAPVSETADALAQPVSDFLARIADPIPAPGGGSAAAVAVAMAAALVRSVASVSRAGWDEAGGVAAQADAISHRVAPLIELDARRYEEALRLLAERGSIAAEERDLRLGAALEGAAAPPPWVRA